MKSQSVTVQLKTIEQYFCGAVYYAAMLVVLNFESGDEIRRYDGSNERCLAVLCCGAVCYAVQVALTFESGNEIINCHHPNESYSHEQYFVGVLFIQGHQTTNFDTDICSAGDNSAGIFVSKVSPGIFVIKVK